MAFWIRVQVTGAMISKEGGVADEGMVTGATLVSAVVLCAGGLPERAVFRRVMAIGRRGVSVERGGNIFVVLDLLLSGAWCQFCGFLGRKLIKGLRMDDDVMRDRVQLTCGGYPVGDFITDARWIRCGYQKRKNCCIMRRWPLDVVGWRYSSRNTLLFS